MTHAKSQSVSLIIVIHVCNTSTWEVEVRGLEAQGDLHTDLKVSLCYMKACLKKCK